MGSSTVPATTGGVNTGFQPATSTNLDEFSLITDADGVVTRTVTIPTGVYSAFCTLNATLTIGSYSYSLTGGSRFPVANTASASSYTLTCTSVISGMIWRDNPTGSIQANVSYGVNNFNYRNLFTGIAFGGSSNLFVMIPSYAQPGGATAYSTPDGITFTARTLPSANFQFVTFAGSLFYAMPNSQGGQLATSTDGITWTARNYSVGGIFTPPVKGSGTNYVAVRRPYSVLETATFSNTQVSTDGLTWAAGGTLPSAASWGACASDGSTNRIVVVATADTGADINTATTKAAYSINNGTSWTASTLPSAQRWTTLRWVPSASLYFTRGSSTIYATSPDGITWTSRTFPNTNIAQAFDCESGPQWIGNNGVSTALYGMQSGNGNFVYYTTDCINFVASTTTKAGYYGITNNQQTGATFGNNIHMGGDFYTTSAGPCIPVTSTRVPVSFGLYSPPTTQV